MARKRGYWKYIAVVVLAVVAFAVAGAALIAQPKPQPGPAPAAAAPMFTASPDLVAPPKLNIAPGTKTLFFGDSWTAGYAAAPSTQGYAYLTAAQLQWDNKVDAVSGTGYQNPGPSNTGNYATRLTKLPDDPELQVLVLQGGLNDGSQAPEGFRQAVLDTLDVARTKFTAAKIVILGPSTPVIPASSGLASINSKLYQIADEQKLNYIAPINEVWINSDNYASVIDTSRYNE